MSLRHLYIDLNCLGVYPDIIFQTFMELPGDDVDCGITDDIIRSVLIPNKYYCYRVYHHKSSLSRKMYSNQSPGAVLLQVDGKFGNKDKLTIIVQGTDTFTIRWSCTSISYNGDLRRVRTSQNGCCLNTLLLLNIRNVNSLDGFEKALRMSII